MNKGKTVPMTRTEHAKGSTGRTTESLRPNVKAPTSMELESILGITKL